MHHPALPRRRARALALAMIGCTLAVPTAAGSRPEPLPSPAPRTASVTVSEEIGADRASLLTTAPSIPSGAAFRYVARVRLSTDADSVQVVFRVRHPGGRLIFQRTRIAGQPSRGAFVTAFERTTEDLGLRAGVYPVELDVTVARAGSRETGSLRTGLLVYAPGAPTLPVAIVARVSAPPLSGPDGRFILDPAVHTRPREDVHDLASWVLARPNARLTLALNPMLIEEWSRIAGGFELTGIEQTRSVSAQEPVPRAYASTLRLLKNATDSGRLELMSIGYSDPDLSALEAAGMLQDVSLQYDQGVSAILASLESTPSTGTMPAGGRVPSTAAPLLAAKGIGYVVVNAAYARSRDATAQATSYRTTGGLVALVPDEAISEAAGAGDASATVVLAFRRFADANPSGPLVISSTLGSGPDTAADLIEGVESLWPHPWASMALAREVAIRPKRTIPLARGSRIAIGPTGYWDTVREARTWVAAFAYAAGEAAPDVTAAVRNSLAAQSSTWEGSSGNWEFAPRGREFADKSKAAAEDTLGALTLGVEPVTLAGTSGDVPVTIRNGSPRPLRVRLRLKGSRGLRVDQERDQELTIGPQETLVEVPVELRGVVSGDLAVDLTAGRLAIDSKAVTIRASYLDRIATVAGTLAVLVMLLVFIIRRVRSSQGSADTDTERAVVH